MANRISKSSSKKRTHSSPVSKQVVSIESGSSRQTQVQHLISGTCQELYQPLRGLLDRSNQLIKLYKERDFEYLSFKEYKVIMESVEAMRDRIQYCFDTTKRLVDLNKKQAGLGDLSADVNVLVAEALTAVKHEKEKAGVKIVHRSGKNLPKVAMDPIDFSQVIINILTNAVQSMAHSGQVTLITKFNEKRRQVVLECRDTGIGIDKEDLPKVFDPFFTTKQRGIGKSSGLGLSIVNSLVKGIGGSVEIKSNLRSGTTVKVCLPVQDER